MPETSHSDSSATLAKKQHSRNAAFRVFVVTAALIVTSLTACIVIVSLKHFTRDNIKAVESNATILQYRNKLPELKSRVTGNPRDIPTRKEYATALYASGDKNEALKQYKEVIRLSPYDAAPYNNLGNIYRDLGNIKNAIDMYRASIKLDKTSINTYANLANIQLYAQNRPNEAIDTYTQGLKALPNNSQLELLLGIAYEKNGDHSKAIQTYEAILSHDSGNAAAQTSLDRLQDTTR